MSLKLVLPPLSLWATSRLTGLLQSKTQADFDKAFDGTFAARCTFTLNGETVSRDVYRTQLRAQSAAAFGERGTTVTIEGQTQVEVGNQGQLSGLVGIFYSAVSESKFLVLGAPAEKRETSSLNVMIEPTEKNPQHPPVPIHGYFDPRRVTSVNQVVSESAHHVTIPHAAIPQKATTTTEGQKDKVELGPGLLSEGPFGGMFAPGPVVFGPGLVRLPAGENGARPEMLPGNGGFGVGPVIAPGIGETLGEIKDA